MRRTGLFGLLLFLPCAACWGKAFTAPTDSPPGSGGFGGSSRESAGGAGGRRDPSSTASSGGASSTATGDPSTTSGTGGAGPGSGGGSTTSSADTSTASSGGGGGGLTLPCAGVDAGAAFGGHCYAIPPTPEATVNFDGAQTACKQLGDSLGRTAYPPMLASASEETFLETTFLSKESKVDAWIGLVCSERSHPDRSDCYCAGGCLSDLAKAEKTESWTWLDGTSTQLVAWADGNPNGDGRCAAIGFNGVHWGWADRGCGDAQFNSVNGVRYYRPICEIE